MQRRQHRRTASEPRSAAEIARAQLGGVSAIGVVCEVRLHRGGRQLTVKSSVEVVNNTDEPLLMFMPIDAAQQPNAPTVQQQIRVEPGETTSLPLRFTANGSMAAASYYTARPKLLLAADGTPTHLYGSAGTPEGVGSFTIAEPLGGK